ncbi:hypothetical protein HDV02_006643 [Globomyces sp. JEL0801]|nr:hypothetical protein HDV02_006643 [Globomyces sp. JEL0801]
MNITPSIHSPSKSQKSNQSLDQKSEDQSVVKSTIRKPTSNLRLAGSEITVENIEDLSPSSSMNSDNFTVHISKPSSYPDGELVSSSILLDANKETLIDSKPDTPPISLIVDESVFNTTRIDDTGFRNSKRVQHSPILKESPYSYQSSTKDSMPPTHLIPISHNQTNHRSNTSPTVNRVLFSENQTEISMPKPETKNNQNRDIHKNIEKVLTTNGDTEVIKEFKNRVVHSPIVPPRSPSPTRDLQTFHHSPIKLPSEQLNESIHSERRVMRDNPQFSGNEVHYERASNNTSNLSESYQNGYSNGLNQQAHFQNGVLENELAESKEHIRSLQYELEDSQLQLIECDKELNKLHSLLIGSQDRENESALNIEALSREIDDIRLQWSQSVENEQRLVNENSSLHQTIATLQNDFEFLSDSAANSKKQLEQQERDFELFSRKIQSQQLRINELNEENIQLKSTLRKLQLNPPLSPKVDDNLSKQLNQALFDVEALQLLVKDLREENETLRSIGDSRTSNNNSIPPQSPSQWALPSQNERTRFLQKIRSYENSATTPQLDNEIERHKSPSRLSYSSISSLPKPIRHVSSTPTLKNRETNLHLKLRSPTTPTPDSKSPFHDYRRNSYTSNSSRTKMEEPIDYFVQKESLEVTLRELVDEKAKLTFELSRVPSSGVKARQRQGELENLLDEVDRKMAATRRQMKDFGIL